MKKVNLLQGMTMKNQFPDLETIQIPPDALKGLQEYLDGASIKVRNLTTSIDNLANSFERLGEAARRAAEAYERYG